MQAVELQSELKFFRSDTIFFRSIHYVFPKIDTSLSQYGIPDTITNYIFKYFWLLLNWYLPGTHIPASAHTVIFTNLPNGVGGAVRFLVVGTIG